MCATVGKEDTITVLRCDAHSCCIKKHLWIAWSGSVYWWTDCTAQTFLLQKDIFFSGFLQMCL
jgi:hypothetical protein